MRGFGDRHTIPMLGGKSVWRQSDGLKEIPPFHLQHQDLERHGRAQHAALLRRRCRRPGARASFGQWPRFKTPYSMGHYKREDIPFQFALAEAFTICDAYHCSITSGTDPNRVVFWAGSNFDPAARARGDQLHRGQSPSPTTCAAGSRAPADAGLHLCRQRPELADHPGRARSRPASAGASIRTPTTTGPAPCTAAWPSRASAMPAWLSPVREGHEPLVAGPARRARARRNPAAGLLGAAADGLVRASRRLDPAQGAEFTAARARTA